MPADRRPFRRETEEARRDALITAALDLVSEGGVAAATVRAIADRAGVTPGLIRHYFVSKEELIRAAYRSHMDGMTQDALAVVAAGPADPVSRLAAFIAATLSPPVTSGPSVGRWAGFLHVALSDPAMQDAHEAGYLGFRDVLQVLIADLGRPQDAAALRRDAIACNAVIDGLWLEASVIPDRFLPGEIVAIGLASVGTLLGIPLSLTEGPKT
ncbi:MAG: TetR family transcriptional regulator [Paracoccaceae bacterium]